ncbi:putative 1-phosphatidylinositol-3-phosphate 5-kinase, partial [Trifolium medium]|nr:putative 1-phosphatidylinositol-3-phosphate 5-kinase [Trifolium medium]
MGYPTMCSDSHLYYQVKRANIKTVVAKKGDPDRASFKLLRLNRLMWDLLIESVVWNQRLKSLRSPEK